MVPEKIKIVCRVRPFLEDEAPDDLVEIDGAQITVANRHNQLSPHRFSFSSCYPPYTEQKDLFERDVLPLIERVFEGYDTTIFAYGVTGSGKTYTMGGTQNDPGIIPRVAEYIFETKEASRNTNVQLTMSYMEILKESVYDLLVSQQKKTNSGLDIREGMNREVFVANLSEVPIHTYRQFQALYSTACRNRSTASTKLNTHSSRSHAILTLNITTTSPTMSGKVENDDEKLITAAKINLIDLAGSEDNRKSGNEKDRMTESAAINKSLFVLGQVVEALNTGSTRIPFRDSKMTRILQPTLGGSSLGMMIINIAPGYKYFTDTIHTLNFANKSRDITNRARSNVKRTRVSPPQIAMAYPSPQRDPVPTQPSRSHKRRSDILEPSGISTPSRKLQKRRSPAHDSNMSAFPQTFDHASRSVSHSNGDQYRHPSTSFQSPASMTDSPERPQRGAHRRLKATGNSRRIDTSEDANVFEKTHRPMEKRVQILEQAVSKLLNQLDDQKKLTESFRQHMLMLEMQLEKQKSTTPCHCQVTNHSMLFSKPPNEC